MNGSARMCSLFLVLLVVVMMVVQASVGFAFGIQAQNCFNSCDQCIDCCAVEYANCINAAGGVADCNWFCEMDFMICIGICQGWVCNGAKPGTCVPAQ